MFEYFGSVLVPGVPSLLLRDYSLVSIDKQIGLLSSLISQHCTGESCTEHRSITGMHQLAELFLYRNIIELSSVSRA